MGIVMAPLASIVLTGVRCDLAGSASGVLSTGVQVGTALGVAVIGVIFAAAQHGAGNYAFAYRTSLLYPMGVCVVLALLAQLLPKGERT